MKVGSLFTGYGGLDLAVGGNLAWYAEIEPAACKVLAHHYPDVPNLGDITQIDWATVPKVDIITGGYPCQPFSAAGLRKGKDDERHLWPFVRDAIRTLGPSYAILENVRGHLTLGFADVLADLADLGFDAEWAVVAAADVGACHRRERLFIVAHPSCGPGRAGQGWGDIKPEGSAGSSTCDSPPVADAGSGSFTGSGATGHGLFQPAECSDQPPADADSKRHGSRQRSAEMAGLDRTDAPETRQRQRARPEPRTGSTDSAADATGAGAGLHGAACGQGRQPSRASKSEVLRPSDREAGADRAEPSGVIAWAQYEPAIRRWERVLGRPAPEPTVVGRSGRPRLNPVFVEWMMGLPEGWVTGHGLTAAQCLKMLGNGVVPQQARHAITHLIGRLT